MISEDQWKDNIKIIKRQSFLLYYFQNKDNKKSKLDLTESMNVKTMSFYIMFKGEYDDTLLKVTFMTLVLYSISPLEIIKYLI